MIGGLGFFFQSKVQVLSPALLREFKGHALTDMKRVALAQKQCFEHEHVPTAAH